MTIYKCEQWYRFRETDDGFVAHKLLTVFNSGYQTDCTVNDDKRLWLKTKDRAGIVLL